METLKSCLQVLEDPAAGDEFSSFELLSDAAKRKQLLDKFNASFSKTVDHVLDLSDFLQRKEQSYLTQIESLTH